MANTYGRQTLGNSGADIQLTADGRPEWKTGGITLDWATVAAVGSDTVVPIDLTTVKSGQKYLRYGQVLTQITASGKYGPYDPAASDGRQTLARGKCWLLNETVLQSGLVPGLPTGATDNPAVFEGGAIWKDRLLATAGTHTLAAGPTYTELEAVLPRLRYVEGT